MHLWKDNSAKQANIADGFNKIREIVKVKQGENIDKLSSL